MIQVCLNGRRGTGDSAAVPMSPGAMAESAAGAVAAGAGEVRVRPRTPCGGGTLSPRVLAAVLTAIRDVVDVPVGVATCAWAEPEPGRRVERVRSWTVLPDHASVEWHEPGAEEVAAVLLERGVGVEAVVRSGTEGARRFLASPLAPRVSRVVAGVTDRHAATVRAAEASAGALLAELGGAHGRPVLLHGEDGGAWPVLRLAIRLGLDTRVGLEDTLLLPDGRPAQSNARLIAAALEERDATSRRIRWASGFAHRDSGRR